MKSRSIRVGISLTILFTVFLLILSCTTRPENVSITQNQNQNQNQNQMKADAPETILAEDACNVGDFNEKIAKIKNRISEKMTTNLKQQHAGDPGHDLPPRFTFDVRKSPNGEWVEVYFEGGVSGVNGLEDLADILNDFKKDRCLLKVYFVPRGKTPPAGSALLSDGFEWTSCEWPMVACPDGVCARPPCVALSPTPRPVNTNTNSNGGRGNN